MIAFFDRIFQRYTPDPFLIALALTAAVAGLATLLTPATSVQVISSWGDGFWSLITFTLQMSMILVSGYILAVSPPVRKLLKAIARAPRSAAQAVFTVSLVSGISCWLNWGFGLIVGAFLALEVARVQSKVSFRVLVASAYSGFLLWHGGLSGSIPLVLNTAGSFSEKWTGGVIPLEQTLFSGFNLVTLAGLLVLLPVLNVYLQKTHTADPSFRPPPESPDPVFHAQTPAEKWENSFWISLLTFGFGAAFLVLQILEKRFSLDLNTVNFIFLFAGILLHKTPRSFLKALQESAEKVGPLLIQYPLYGGIMAIMVQTGLAETMSKAFVSISVAETFPWLSFLSAGLVNLFVPSGGGQWAVQAPIVLPAAQELGVSASLTAMAVAWGDAWTNMLQPFWALPLLAIAQLKAKDILGFCLMILLVSGAWISFCLLLFGML